MIPNHLIDLTDSDFEVAENESSLTYKMNLTSKTINGKTDGLEAMKQAVYKILNTERFEYPIYSQNYGIELYDLYGEDPAWVCPELERRIIEALTQDTRIKEVDTFDFVIDKSRIYVSFIVHTVFGDIEAERQVDY